MPPKSLSLKSQTPGRLLLAAALSLIPAAALPLHAQKAAPPAGEETSKEQSTEARLSISAEKNLITPWRGIAYSSNDIQEVRRLALEDPANARVVQEILSIAQTWLERSDEEIAAFVPEKGAPFAQGFAGDPKTGKPWPRFGSEGLCSLDRPGEVRSPDTGDIYGTQKRGEEYYDDGNGWTRPSDGRKFYFKAIWNSYVVTQLHDAIDNLALAYMLTGDERAAARALFIFDQLATQMAHSPEYICMIDSVSFPKERTGFFRYQGNLANQRAINSALALDLLGGSPAASAPSSFDPKLSRRDNIAAHYFNLYERSYYLDMRGALTNHGSILFGNIIAQGVLFGKPDLLRTGIDALYSFIDSTINRDGDYMELAGGYGRLGRDYGSRLVALLQYYDPKNYDNASEMPKREDYPYNLRVADDPRWYQTVVKMLYRMTVARRYPQYGDVTPDRMIQLDKNNVWLDVQRNQYLRMYREQTTRQEWKDEIANLYYSDEPQHVASRVVTEDYLLYGKSQWERIPRPEKIVPATDGQESELMGGKAIAILRSGPKNSPRALFMRGGPNGAHGHDDNMAIVPFGHGMTLTGVYGYGTSETPDHLGWGSRAIAHLTATVNEDLPASYLYKGFGNRMNTRNRIKDIPAASVTGFGKTTPAQFVEMRNPDLWKHVRTSFPVTDYRRTSWMIDIDTEKYYFVDIFRLSGGNTHDYVWNAMPVGAATENFAVEGVAPAANPDVWTLAALNGKWRKADWNKPGQSWGERLDARNAGRILPLPGQSEAGTELVGQRHPPADPGNGYGMIWDIRSQETSDDWQAIWKLQDRKNFMRAWFVNYDGMTAITGKSPSLDRHQHHNVALARRNGTSGVPLQSRFVNVVEVGDETEWAVHKVHRLADTKEARNAASVALKLELNNGTVDYLVTHREAAVTKDDPLHFEGRTAFARVDSAGEAIHLFMQEGSVLELNGIKLECPEPLFEAKVIAVNAKPDGEITLDRPLPAGAGLRGHALLLRGNPKAAIPVKNDEYFEIEDVLPGAEGSGSILQFHNQSLALARTDIDTIDAGSGTITTRWPSEIAGLANIAYLNGRGITVEDGEAPRAVVQSFSRKELKVSSAASLKPGQHLKILAAQPGDIAAIPATLSLTLEAPGEYLLRSNTALTVTLPAGKGETVTVSSANGEQKTFTAGDKNVEIKLEGEWFANGPVTLRKAMTR